MCFDNLRKRVPTELNITFSEGFIRIDQSFCALSQELKWLLFQLNLTLLDKGN